jgi:hypothetical protein
MFNTIKKNLSTLFIPNQTHGKKLKKSYFDSLSRHELHNVLLGVVNKETGCGSSSLENIKYNNLNSSQVDRLKRALSDPEYWRYDIVSDILHNMGYYIKLEPVKIPESKQ